SKAYRSKTGIAGYTLIYDSHSLRLAEHHAGEGDTPTVRVVEKMERRVSIGTACASSRRPSRRGSRRGLRSR
ncbi:MAG: fructose-bisphosphatase class III, partial [Kiritimatiellae bacterium]|nr:fructose-bisphosphatase class III [Kiritimatiellia bacterium]